ncbi:MAG: hypothetical protein M1827_002977 [Pycnora praestabilis]|nr:MAG: hypothetical protein M1827_002977 [Pycnora praestabilis]
MVSLADVRGSIATLKNLPPGLVALFVGATSGIGESTLRQFYLHTTKPRVYLVGRNEEAGSRIVDELKSLNADGEVTFIQKDVSLLKNVDEVCSEIAHREKQLNLLFMTPGYLTFQGRNPSTEGLDKKFAVHYYARMRFANNLLPLLQAASTSASTTTPPALSRVVSILAAGHEGPIVENDLGLDHHFSLGNCAAHATVMTDFAFEELAKEYPNTSFVHSYPGFLSTGITRGLSAPLRMAMKVLTICMSPWTVNVGESGERNLFHATSPSYPPASTRIADAAATSSLQKEDDVALGSTGEKGSGAYLLNWNGEVTGKQKLLKDYRERGVGKKIWEHTLEVFKRIEPSTAAS